MYLYGCVLCTCPIATLSLISSYFFVTWSCYHVFSFFHSIIKCFHYCITSYSSSYVLCFPYCHNIIPIYNAAGPNITNRSFIYFIYYVCFCPTDYGSKRGSLFDSILCGKLICNTIWCFKPQCWMFYSSRMLDHIMFWHAISI